MILTGPQLSPIKSSFLASPIKSSRMLPTTNGQVEMSWVQGYAQDLDISDMSYFPFPTGQAGKWRREIYITVDGTTIESQAPAEGDCRINPDGSLAFYVQTVADWTTYHCPWVDSNPAWTTDPWNPRAVRARGRAPDLIAENWNVRVHGPVTGALVQYAARAYDTYYVGDYMGFEDSVMWTDVEPLTVTDVTIASGNYYDFTPTDAPATGQISIAIFWVNKSTADF